MRSGNTAGATNVDYATFDGSASERSDYITSLGTLRFAADETEKTIRVLIVDDAFVEGFEGLTLTLSNSTDGIVLGATSSIALTIVDNDATPTSANPIDTTEFFVRQQYLDFLNRQPDAAGLAFWSNVLNNQMAECNSQPAGEQRNRCISFARVRVSAAFFLSIEFQETGFLVIRYFRGALGRQPDFREFLRDTQEMQRGVVIGQPGALALLEANTVRVTQEFVSRPEFVARYPQGSPAATYVDALYASEGVTPSASERNQAIAAYGSGDTAGRAAALRVAANNSQFRNREFRPAFVLMQYFGYLRRDPDDAGFNFWLNKLNEFNGNYEAAEMVRAFILSTEYRSRFGQP